MTIKDVYPVKTLIKYRKYNLINDEIEQGHYGSRDEIIIDMRLNLAFTTAESLAGNRKTDLFNHVYDYIMNMSYDEIKEVIEGEEKYKQWLKVLKSL